MEQFAKEMKANIFIALGEISYIPTFGEHTYIFRIRMMRKCFPWNQLYCIIVRITFFTEPVGSKAPTFSTELQSISIKKHFGSSFALLSNAQGYPVPLIRDVSVNINAIFLLR